MKVTLKQAAKFVTSQDVSLAVISTVNEAVRSAVSGAVDLAVWGPVYEAGLCTSPSIGSCLGP